MRNPAVEYNVAASLVPRPRPAFRGARGESGNEATWPRFPSFPLLHAGREG